MPDEPYQTPPYTTDPDDAYTHGGQERLEAKLRLFVLRRHLKEATAGVLDHVIHELGMMALGKKADGSPLEIEPRTQQQAMATYLRNVEKVARMGAAGNAADPRVQILAVTAETMQRALKEGANRRPLLADLVDPPGEGGGNGAVKGNGRV